MSIEEQLANSYSLGRADAGVEYNKNLSFIRGLIEKLDEDVQKNREQYRGGQDIYNKSMMAFYGGKHSALYEVLSCFDFLGINIEEEKKNGTLNP